MRQNAYQRFLRRTAILLLLVSVAGLATTARYSSYLPESSPIHFIAGISKMDVDHLPVLFAPVRVNATAIIAPPEQTFQCWPESTSQKIELPQIGLTLSLQHRSPPSSLA
jgi:hypothetical protein